MQFSNRWIKPLWQFSLAASALLLAGQAQALPSYARQTGQDCVACHIGAFGPQLTPYGIKFKLGGYVDGDGKDGKVPLSGMVVAGYSHNKDISKTQLEEASVFLAGKLADHVGSFVQVTHDGTEHHTSIDQADVRVTNATSLNDQDLLLGVSVNNNPGVQDPFNTLPVWQYPYTGSPHNNAIGAEFTGFGSPEQRVIGVNAYAMLNDSIYGEAGLYNTLSTSVQSRLGLVRDDAQAFGHINNAPYWRLGYLKDMKTQSWTAGLVGFSGNIKSRDSTDYTHFRDMGVDAGYQFLGNRQHVFTVNASYMHEHTDANSAGDVTPQSSNDYRLTGSYQWHNTCGATVSMFKGSTSDHTLYNSGVIYQADWTPWGKESSWAAPWANLRFGVQYVAYNHYTSTDEGVTTVETKPSDKNTLNVFAWTSF